MARSAQAASTGSGTAMSRRGGAPNGMEGSGSSTSTGSRDEVYGIVSVLYHALQGAETYEQYIADAKSAGDDDLEQFFQSCRSEERQRAERAKSLLLERLDDVEEDSDDSDDSGEEDDEDEE